MKADLHYHGPIGFQDYWLKLQGYEGENMLQLIADACFSNGLDLCSITSEETDIPRGSVQDRLGHLVKQIKTLPQDYKAGKLGENVLVVEHQARKVYLLNSQTVLCQDNGRRTEFLVVGTNQVPNLLHLKQALAYANDKKLITVAEHPYCRVHGGIEQRGLEENHESFDAIETHNSQFRWGSWIPILGNYSRQMNEQAAKFAQAHGKPGIATSDGHWVHEAGISYIEFHGKVDTTSDETIFRDLKTVIKAGERRETQGRVVGAYENHCEYSKFRDWLKTGYLLKVKVKEAH